MKKPVDDDSLVTMLGVSGYIWAGSFNGNVYVFHMDNYELYKTFAGHRDSVWCLCPMLDMYVVSGSAQNDRSIIVWENVETSNNGNTKTSNNGNTKGDFIKPIDIL
jgi:WD40 repeat protein